MRRVGIIYNFRIDAARDLASALQERLAAARFDCWARPTNKDAEARELAAGTDVLVSVGGDGTILRAARVAVPLGVPILGVNMGRVGFMTEVRGAEALKKVPHYLRSDIRLEERAMLDVEILPSAPEPGRETGPFLALNDVVAGRGAVARVTHIEVRVNGSLLTNYRADAVIVSTATGSTGYALASGGPIMHPESKELLLVPVSPHLCLSSPVSMPPDAVVEMRLLSGVQALCSVDGQTDLPLRQGDAVRARRSSRVARFLRAAPASAFYATLTERLRLYQGE